MLTRLLPLALATFVVGTDNFVIAGLLPAISADLGVSTSTAGQLVTAFALTFAISATVLSAAMSGLDRRTAMLIALAVFVAGNVVAALGGSYPVVLVGRVVAAVGAGTITSSASAVAAATSAPERRARAMSLVLGGMSVATALGSPLGTLIGSLDWRLTMWSLAGLGAVTMIGIRLGLPPVRLPSTSLRERLDPLRHPHVLVVLATTVLVFAGTYAVYTYIASVLHPVTGGSARVLTPLLLVLGLGTIVGTLVSGRLADRLSPSLVLVGQLLLTVGVLLVGPLATGALPTAAVWMAVWGVCMAAATVPQQLRLVEGRAAAMPVLLGLNSSAIYLGIFVGGGLGGVLLRFVRPGSLLPLVSALAILALVATVVTEGTAGRRGLVVRRQPDPEVCGHDPARSRDGASTRGGLHAPD